MICSAVCELVRTSLARRRDEHGRGRRTSQVSVFQVLLILAPPEAGSYAVGALTGVLSSGLLHAYAVVFRFCNPGFTAPNSLGRSSRQQSSSASLGGLACISGLSSPS